MIEKWELILHKGGNTITVTEMIIKETKTTMSYLQSYPQVNAQLVLVMSVKFVEKVFIGEVVRRRLRGLKPATLVQFMKEIKVFLDPKSAVAIVSVVAKLRSLMDGRRAPIEKGTTIVAVKIVEAFEVVGRYK